MKTFLATLLFLLSSFAHAQAGFATNATGGNLWVHQDCSTIPCTQLDSRISTSSTPGGFSTPATVVFEHVLGKDFDINPNFGVLSLGSFRLGTGSFLSGSLTGTALFDVDQSFVTISSNGNCGEFKVDGSCQTGGFTPNTDTLFVGVFVGKISWFTNPDNSHVLQGTVMGFVNGGTTVVFRNLIATSVPDPNPFVNSGRLVMATVTIAPF